jgi:hypothetical protein
MPGRAHAFPEHPYRVRSDFGQMGVHCRILTLGSGPGLPPGGDQTWGVVASPRGYVRSHVRISTGRLHPSAAMTGEEAGAA